MKSGIFKIIVPLLLLASCSKDNTGAATVLLTKYQWYATELDVTTYTAGRDTVLSTNVIAQDSCIKASYYTFKADHTVTRSLPCVNGHAAGSWTLSADSSFVVSIPYQSFDVGFISVNAPLKLYSIDNNEMKTNYSGTVIFYANGMVNYYWQSSTMVYKHY